jgi:hypothetical protein
MNSANPMKKQDPENPGYENMVAMTEAEVRESVEGWYDEFVTKNG